MNKKLREKHHKYPFVEIGPTQAFYPAEDIESIETVLGYDEWIIFVE